MMSTLRNMDYSGKVTVLQGRAMQMRMFCFRDKN